MYIMPKKERDRAEYLRSYHLENHEKQMVNAWRKRGHYIPEGTEHDAYVRFRDTTHCEFCGWELVTGGKTRTNTKVRHHDHTIEGEDNFIAVICHVCNTRERCDNTSGEPNISYVKSSGNWRVIIGYCGKKHTKGGLKTFEDALTYKAAWYALNSPNAFHDPACTVEQP